VTIPALAILPFGVDLDEAVTPLSRRRSDPSRLPPRLPAAMDFRTTSLTALADLVRTRRVSARELTTTALDRIDALNPLFNAFVACTRSRQWRTPPPR